jgi:hypothetical protein
VREFPNDTMGNLESLEWILVVAERIREVGLRRGLASSSTWLRVNVPE